MAPVLSIENLSLALPTSGDRPFAIRDLSLTVERGETVCVVGESGSGKSMTALAVMGLLPRKVGRIAKGSIAFRGKEGAARDLAGLDAEGLRRIRGNESRSRR